MSKVIFLQLFDEDGFEFVQRAIPWNQKRKLKSDVGYVRSDIAVELYEENKRLLEKLNLLENILNISNITR